MALDDSKTSSVYIEEIESYWPIEAVGTSIAAFVGRAPAPAAHLNKQVWINNWIEFVRNFAPERSSTPLSHAVYGFFLNGGGRCWVVNVGDGPIAAGLDVLEDIDEVAIVAAPGYTDAASYNALLSHCEKMHDRVAILDAPEVVENVKQLTQTATRGAEGLRPRQSDGGFGAVYFPWIAVSGPFATGRSQVNVPPSGHIAGIWARSDATRGVHKAPANERIHGALGLTYQVTSEEQSELHRNGINCIRSFGEDGIVVVGARTLADNSSHWRHLNVRRLLNMIKESIAESTRWCVFEPNERPTWKAIHRDISAFLAQLWRTGALMGTTAEQAFFVKCDEETNPIETIREGIVTIVVGIAPIRPAEFIVFRIHQKQSGTEIEE